MFAWPLYGLSTDLIGGAVWITDELLNPRETTTVAKCNDALECKTVL